MNRTNSPVYVRQMSISSSSPSGSPVHPSSRMRTSMSTVKRTRNVEAAAQRLAKVMATRPDDDFDDEYDENEFEDDGFQFGPSTPVFSGTGGSNNISTSESSNGSGGSYEVSGSRRNRSPSPLLGGKFTDIASPVRSTPAGRIPISARTGLTTVAPPSRRPSLKTHVNIPAIDTPRNRIREKTSEPELGWDFNHSGNPHDASELRDELDMLQEENEAILDKLYRAEEECEEAEARARELEKQVASLGEGASFEVKLLNRKEAALRQREAALKADEKRNGGRDRELAALREGLENLKDEAVTSVEKLGEAEFEASSLRNMMQRMILTHEEMEEVVLKRCWLARYWTLASRYGICADIAVSKYEYWSSLAPLPFEVVISAGHRAKEETWNGGDDSDRGNLARDLDDITGEGNIENMLSVEMGIRELASLKVEDAVVLTLAQNRRSASKSFSVADHKASSDPKFMEAVALSQEETDDVLFKQAWLTYFWRRAKVHGVEMDISEERLQFWINRSRQSPTSHDAVDVERGLIELRKLGIEQQLWEASRKELMAS